jgi:protease IV
MNKLYDYLKNIFVILILLQVAPALIKSINKQYSKLIEPGTKVASIKIKGIITDAAKYRKDFEKYFQDADIKAILLRIESPGGAAGSGQSLYLDLLHLKQKHPKPVLVLIENICASAAYYIASGADWIICAPSALVGSIGGYLPAQFNVKDLLKNWNVDVNVIGAGKYKTIGNPFTPSSPEGVALLQSIADDAYEQFTHDIATARKLSLKDIDDWANGKIFTGKQAYTHKLVDQLGSYLDAVTWIKKHAGIKNNIEWVKPPKQTLINKILGENDDEDDNSLLSECVSTIAQKVYQLMMYTSI